jgi:hypothetical protein
LKVRLPTLRDLPCAGRIYDLLPLGNFSISAAEVVCRDWFYLNDGTVAEFSSIPWRNG